MKGGIQLRRCKPSDKNHKVVWWKGEWCALLPGKRRWVVTREEEEKTVHERIVDTNLSVTNPAQLENTFAILEHGLFASYHVATGVTLDDLVKTQVASESQTMIPPPAQPATVNLDADDKLLEGMAGLGAFGHSLPELYLPPADTSSRSTIHPAAGAGARRGEEGPSGVALPTRQKAPQPKLVPKLKLTGEEKNIETETKPKSRCAPDTVPCGDCTGDHLRVHRVWPHGEVLRDQERVQEIPSHCYPGV